MTFSQANRLPVRVSKKRARRSLSRAASHQRLIAALSLRASTLINAPKQSPTATQTVFDFRSTLMVLSRSWLELKVA